jgi:hypothetical protein
MVWSVIYQYYKTFCRHIKKGGKMQITISFRLVLMFIILFFAGCASMVQMEQMQRKPIFKSQWNDTDDTKTFKSGILINKLLRSGERVALIIIGGQFYNKGQPDAAWKSSEQNRAEGFYLKLCGNNTRCSVVNRNALQSHISEMVLSGSGLTSDATRVKIGELTGATHLILIEGNLIYRGPGYSEWTTYWKLIDIKSGNLLTIDKEEASSQAQS